MKEFLSIQKFKEIKVLFILEIMIAVLASILIHINNFNLNYFDWKALSLSLAIWILSSIVDKENYFNLATLIGISIFMYTCFWLMFNLHITN